MHPSTGAGAALRAQPSQIGAVGRFERDCWRGLAYRFESFRSDDFALDGVDEGTIPRVITLGNHSFHYNAHLVGASLSLYF